MSKRPPLGPPWVVVKGRNSSSDQYGLVLTRLLQDTKINKTQGYLT